MTEKEMTSDIHKLKVLGAILCAPTAITVASLWYVLQSVETDLGSALMSTPVVLCFCALMILLFAVEIALVALAGNGVVLILKSQTEYISQGLEALRPGRRILEKV